MGLAGASGSTGHVAMAFSPHAVARLPPPMPAPPSTADPDKMNRFVRDLYVFKNGSRVWVSGFRWPGVAARMAGA